MKIYKNENELLLDIEVDDNSYRNRAIMGDNTLVLYYALEEHVELPVGAWCIFDGTKYSLMRPQAFKMKHSRNFEYTVTLQSAQAYASIWKFRNPVDGRLKFSLTATPKEHLQMLVDNLNRHDNGWTVGDCIDETEHLISYDHAYLSEAIKQMADEFDTEYEYVNKQVSLHKVEHNKNNPLALAYGKGKGFKPELGRSNTSDTPPVEILYVQGGSDNIDRSKYPSDENLRASSNGCLLLPVGQTLSYDGEYYEDEDGFNAANARTYVVDERGLSITNAGKTPTSYAEDSLDRSDDYPKRVGTISSVVEVDSANNFWDIVDDNIPDELNYNDYQIDGETMTVVFQSGELAGKEFEATYIHEAKRVNGVDKKARRFELVPQEIDGVTMPGGTFIPKAGDTYAVFNVMLPDAYICNNKTKSGASWDMFRAAVKYLFENEEQKYSFTGEMDGIWAKKDWENISSKLILGGYISFTDERFQKEPVLVRITGIKDYINKPHSPKIELSNETIASGTTTTIKTLESNEQQVDENYDKAVRFTKRRFRDAKETQEMLEQALLKNFTNSITPITVQTMSMLVGDESLQFRFISSMSSQTVIDPDITYDTAAQKLKVGRCLLQHMTLGIANISASHKANEYLYWQMGAFESAQLTDTSKRYFLYAKVDKAAVAGTASTGVFELAETAREMDDNSGNYNLLVGILNSEYDGERSYVSLYGFTEVLPGRVTTDKIVSTDGNTFFDLVHGIIQGKIQFLSGSNGLSNLDEYKELEQSITDAKNAAGDAQSSATDANNAIEDLKNNVEGAFRDGIIDEAEAKAIATYINNVNNTKAAVTSTYAQLYLNDYLEGLPKSGLKTAYDALMDSISDLIKTIQDAISDRVISDGESTSVDDGFEDYNEKYSEYQTAVEVAMKSILDAINKKAEKAQETADQAVTDAKNAQTDASSALIQVAALDKSVGEFKDEVEGDFRDGIIDEAEAKAIATYINVVNNTKASIEASYEKLYNNSYSSDESKEALKEKYEALLTAIDALLNAVETAIADGKATEAEAADVNEKFNDYSNALKEYNETIETTYNDIRAVILIQADESAKEDVAALGETIIDGGYIKTDLIKATELIIRHVLVETGIKGDGRKVEISPDTLDIKISDKDGNVASIFEGNSYDSINKMFGDSNGDCTITKRTEEEVNEKTEDDETVKTKTYLGYAAGISYGRGKFGTLNGNTISVDDDGDIKNYTSALLPVTEAWNTDTPTEVTVKGDIYAYAENYYEKDDKDILQTEKPASKLDLVTAYQDEGFASATFAIYIYTYSDELLENLIERMVVTSYSVQAYAGDSTTGFTSKGGWKSVEQKVKVAAGYHVIRIQAFMSARGNSTAEAMWGYTTTGKNDLSASYQSEFYVSRYFANGFCLGTKRGNYAAVWKDSEGMNLAMENNGYGLKCSSKGIMTKHHEGQWMSMPLLAYRATFTYNSSTTKYVASNEYSFNGDVPTPVRVAMGQIRLNFPTSWQTKLSPTLSNTIVNVTGYGQDAGGSTNPVKANLYDFTSTYLIVTISDDASENDGAFIINIWTV
jgi:hypothetical protein